MSLGERIRKVREVRGLNQKTVAERMKVSIVTYGSLEDGANTKYSNLKKFCDAVQVDLSFLISNLPVTDETLSFFDKLRPNSFLLTYEELRQRVEVYGELLNLDSR